MQACRAIHVAERSTAFMGLQFNDPSYNRPMSTGSGEPRRLKSRLPGAIWAGGGLLLLLLIIFLARQIILPFLLAIFLSYLLLPLVNAMTEPGPGGRRTPRALAAFLALAAFIGVLVVAILVLAPLLAGEANRLGPGRLCTRGPAPHSAPPLSATFQAWRHPLSGAA